jgi:hypothetical protein
MVPATPITKATLQAKLLAAFSATNEIALEHSTYTINREPPTTYETWSYPLQPSVGQQVRTRTIDIGRGHFDSGESYLMPPVSRTGSTRAKAEVTSVSYTSKVWWHQRDPLRSVTPPIGPTLIANLPPLGKWTAHNTTLNGRAAIEFTTKSMSSKDGWLIDTLWVDASTYLPLRQISDIGSPGFDTVGTSYYQYLPATPANLAKLTPPIPAGFKQITPTPFPINPKKVVTQSPAPSTTSSR